MKLFKGKYGWNTTAHSKTNDGRELKCYLNAQFAKKSDPSGEEIDGRLIFKTKEGEYECFFSSFESKGSVCPKIVLMPVKREQIPLTNDEDRDMFGRKQNLKVESDELPFY